MLPRHVPSPQAPMKPMKKPDPKLVQLGEDRPWLWGVDGAGGDLTASKKNVKNVSFVTSKEYGRSIVGPEVQRSRGPEVQRSRGPEVPRSVPLVGLVSAAVCWRCCWAFPPCSLAPPAWSLQRRPAAWRAFAAGPRSRTGAGAGAWRAAERAGRSGRQPSDADMAGAQFLGHLDAERILVRDKRR